jgi:hypothetical protein
MTPTDSCERSATTPPSSNVYEHTHNVMHTRIVWQCRAVRHACRDEGAKPNSATHVNPHATALHALHPSCVEFLIQCNAAMVDITQPSCTRSPWHTPKRTAQKQCKHGPRT